jgi:release factor glutamine methyltransferase
LSRTVAAALAEASARLAAAGVETPSRDARLLLADALGAQPSSITLRLSEDLPPHAAAVFAGHVDARAQRRPVAQILGRRAFWGREFEVTPDVLDPRPETETLVALALEGGPATRVLDLGTGSGVLLVTLLAEWPNSRGLGTDVSASALAVASRNAALHGVAARASLLQADWTDGVAGRFDLVVGNPPYIPTAVVAELSPEVRAWEPIAALSPGPTGLEAYARIAAGLGDVLAPGGRAILEFGSGQGAAVAAILAHAGFGRISLYDDLDGRARAVSVIAPAA